MKKKYVLGAILILLVALIFAGCTGKSGNEYFNNFSSRSAFTKAEKRLVLPDGVSVYSYDAENDIFITYMLVTNGLDETQRMYLYGLTTLEEELVFPAYTAVIAIKGDYAIVTKPTRTIGTDGNPTTAYVVGVVKFRGSGAGELTDFNTSYIEGYEQFRFVGDYIVSIGTKDNPSVFNSYSTFYDYSQGVMLEKFRIRCGTDYDMYEYDGHVVAVGKDHAFFYEEDDPIVDGYRLPSESGYYIAYPEDTEGEYTEYISVDIFYLGNGWFSRTARLTSTSIFQGYNIIYDEMDPNNGSVSTVYANIRCDLYNARTRTVLEKGWLLVEGVANKFNADYYTELSAYLNNLSNYDSDRERYEYHLPYMDIAKIIKDGYSVVWYYYLPYADDDNYMAEITFCIMDEAARIINIEDALMPIVFVDGHGVESADPMYEQYYGSVSYFDYELNKKTLASYEGGVKTYATYVWHNGGAVASEINYQQNSVLYGIVDETGAVIVPFEYIELSPFYGDYAIGTKDINGYYQTYRIARDGTETVLNDSVNVRQGVYVYEYDKKLGLKNYDGTVLLNAEYDNLDVFEVFLRDGVYQTDFVVTVKDGKTEIFTLD